MSFRITLNNLEFHHSAGRHGIRPEDVDHAIEHALVVVDLHPESDPPKALVIGPRSDGQLVEIAILALAEDRQLVIHAMKLRSTFHALLPEGDL